jgi:hypothetical protein
MEIPKDKVLDLIRERGAADDADQADGELPDPVDPERDSAVLSKFGVEPKDLIERFKGSLPGL